MCGVVGCVSVRVVVLVVSVFVRFISFLVVWVACVWLLCLVGLVVGACLCLCMSVFVCWSVRCVFVCAVLAAEWMHDFFCEETGGI